jgi:hypothetical protein
VDFYAASISITGVRLQVTVQCLFKPTFCRRDRVTSPQRHYRASQNT